MTVKLIILCSLFAIAFGFTIPEDQLYNRSNSYERALGDDQSDDGSLILIRNARSPQRRIDAAVEHSSRFGTSANINYNHLLGRHFEACGGVSRNLRYNENSGHIGLRYRF